LKGSNFALGPETAYRGHFEVGSIRETLRVIGVRAAARKTFIIAERVGFAGEKVAGAPTSSEQRLDESELAVARGKSASDPPATPEKRLELARPLPSSDRSCRGLTLQVSE
jgi:hypothetical protein